MNAVRKKVRSAATSECVKKITGNRIAIVTFAFLLVVMWAYLRFFHPITFWGVGEDGPIMSLAEAVNLDFWFSEKGSRGISQAQFYQPGMYYQLTSWVAYRLSSAPVFGFDHIELFKKTMVEPHGYWQITQVIPLLISFVTLGLLWMRVRKETLLTLIACITIYFAAVPAMRYGVWMLFNESFSFLFAVVFFTSCHRLFLSGPILPWKKIFVCGLLGGLLYLHKMNYVVWALALLPAIYVSGWLNRMALRRMFGRMAVYFLTIVLTVQAFGRLFLGSHGFHQMIDGHKAIFMGSGIYGNGDRSVVKASVVIENLKGFWVSDPFTLILVLILIGISFFAVYQNRKNRDWLRVHAPEGVLLIGAAGLMSLALLKHFQPYYTVSVAALFPLIVLWLANAGQKRALPWLLPLIVLGIGLGIQIELKTRKLELVAEARSLSDETATLAMKLDPGGLRYWMYRIVSPSFQRLFLVDFSGLPKLIDLVSSGYGEQRLISPWLDVVLLDGKYQKISETPWQYIVVGKSTLALYVDKKMHLWTELPNVKKTELMDTLVYENTAFRSIRTQEKN